MSDETKDTTYEDIGVIFAAITFLGAWVWCIDAYGFMLGVGLGWFPSLIAAAVMRWIWPLAVLAVAWVAWELFMGAP